MYPICPCGSKKAKLNVKAILDHDWRNIDSMWAVKCEDCGQDVMRSLAEIMAVNEKPERKRSYEMNIEISRDDLALICDSLDHERDLWIKVHEAIGGSDAEQKMNEAYALNKKLRARLVEEDGGPT